MLHQANVAQMISAGGSVSTMTDDEIALLSFEQKVKRAGQALTEADAEGVAAAMDPSALADEVDRRSGVGFETATLVVLASGR